MKRLVVFWVVAAAVGVVAVVTSFERSESDRESAQAADRTPSVEPVGDDDPAFINGSEGDGGSADGAAPEQPDERAKQQAMQVDQSDQRAKRSGKSARRQRATATATDEPGRTAATATSTADPTRWQEAPDADASQCPSTSSGIVVDRQWQRAWLCADGAVATVFPITSAASQPDLGTYPIYALDYQTYSQFGDAPSTLDRFVAFTYGKYQGARIGFHAVPYYADGSLAQPLESVGELARFGESSGCIRVLPEHAELIYSTMQVGDEVRVIS